MDMDRICIDNAETNCVEIQDRKVSLLSKPQRLTVSLTTRCNLACRMCTVRKMVWEIPQKTIKEIICLFPYLRWIAWQGGEVFLFDSFKEILEEASKYQNLIHEITTNGHLLDEKWIERLSKIDLNLCISIDGVTKNTYEYIRRGSKFEQLSRILNLINENKKKSNKLRVLSLVVTVMKSNYRELDLFVEFARKYGFDKIFLQPIGGNFNSEENIFYHNDKEALLYIEGIKPKMEKKAEECGIEFYEWLPTKANSKEPAMKLNEAKTDRSNDKFFCLAPWQQLFIDWEGNVYPHCLCLQEGPNESKNVGNVLEKSLTEIWNGEKIQLLRKRFLDNNFLHLCCHNCIKGLVPDNLRSFRCEVMKS